MGCKQKTIKYAKYAWKVLGPVLAPHVAQGVALVNEVAGMVPELLESGHDKRKFVLDRTLRKAQDIAHDAYDDAKDVTVSELKGAIRGQIERSVYLLNGAYEGWEDTVDTADELTPVSV
jgi:hypothetical protein